MKYIHAYNKLISIMDLWPLPMVRVRSCITKTLGISMSTLLVKSFSGWVEHRSRLQWSRKYPQLIILEYYLIQVACTAGTGILWLLITVKSHDAPFTKCRLYTWQFPVCCVPSYITLQYWSYAFLFKSSSQPVTLQMSPPPPTSHSPTLKRIHFSYETMV